MKIAVNTLAGGKSGELELDDAVFGLEPRADILHRMVTWQLAKRRAGTRRIKTRGEVAYSGRKIVRQKGSGGARHGDRKVSQFRGGAKAHGPVVRDHSHGLPKKVRAMALRHALSAKARRGDLIVIDEAALPEAKTKAAKKAFGDLGYAKDWRSALVVGGAEINADFARAARNLPEFDVLPMQGANVYDILRRDKLVLTRAAAEGLQERLK